MRFEKLFRRFKKAARSQGAYFGSAVTASEADFLCAIVIVEETVDLENGEWEAGIEVGVIRRFFARLSVAVPSGLEALFTSFEEREVVDLLPMPLRRALNLRFVAFMARGISRVSELERRTC